jgi:hypothetical protein
VAQTKVNKIVSPNLPVAPMVYQRVYHDQFSNVLRLYFNQVDNSTQQLTDAVNSLSTQQWLGMGGGC